MASLPTCHCTFIAAQLTVEVLSRTGNGQFALAGPDADGGCALHGVTRPSEKLPYGKTCTLLAEYNVEASSEQDAVALVARLVAEGAREAVQAGHLKAPSSLHPELTRLGSIYLGGDEHAAQNAALGREQLEHEQVGWGHGVGGW